MKERLFEIKDAADKFAMSVFAVIGVMRSLLRHYLDPKTLARLDLRTLRLVYRPYLVGML
ncbi:MAG: hypothetical protein NUW37_12790 [Planctomycetes bacterium]|nr:hypothetical protein [Planctomycetota bacterium]